MLDSRQKKARFFHLAIFPRSLFAPAHISAVTNHLNSRPHVSVHEAENCRASMAITTYDLPCFSFALASLQFSPVRSLLRSAPLVFSSSQFNNARDFSCCGALLRMQLLMFWLSEASSIYKTRRTASAFCMYQNELCSLALATCDRKESIHGKWSSDFIYPAKRTQKNSSSRQLNHRTKIPRKTPPTKTRRKHAGHNVRFPRSALKQKSSVGVRCQKCVGPPKL